MVGPGLQGSGAIEAFVAAGYGKGEILPNTCADLERLRKPAVEYDVPVINFDYLPAMGADPVDLALEVLAGHPVPKIYEVNVDVIVSKGHETLLGQGRQVGRGLRADGQARRADPLDRPRPDYDPSTFKVDYPQ